MKISDFQSRIVALYQSRAAIYLRSSPGRGKSTVIEGAPALLSAALGGNYGMVVVNAGNMNVPDAGGYLIPTEQDGRMSSRYTEPYWFVTEEGKHITEYDGGIIFIDEMDKADVDVKKILGEAMLSGRLATHHLPKNWVVWGAGNLQGDRSGSTKELDHLINRRVEITIDDNLQAWDDWAATNDVHPVIRTFANQNPQIVFQAGVPDTQGPWATPRSVVNCGRLLMQFALPDGSLPDDHIAKELAAGMIGTAASAQLFATIQLEHEAPAYADVLADPLKAKCPGASNPAAAMLICYQLAARVTEADAPAVVQYIERMPQEFAVLFAKAACKRNPMLVETDTFGDWAAKNSSLMQAIINTRSNKK